MPATRKPVVGKSPRPRSTAKLLGDAGDALFRAAVEACRQHERVSRLIDEQCAEDELLDAAAVCALCARQLTARTAGYGSVAAAGRGKADETFWHAANSLWHASREYVRRHTSSDTPSARRQKHSSDELGALTMDYELEASALLALRQAISRYRKGRPVNG